MKRIAATEKHASGFGRSSMDGWGYALLTQSVKHSNAIFVAGHGLPIDQARA
jgi:hypothetical protein